MAGQLPSSPGAPTRRFIGWTLLLLLAQACRPDGPPTAAFAPGGEPMHARGGPAGGGGGTATELAVSSTDPASAAQDTTLDVTVYGAGFATGAQATWSLAGDTTRVHVLSTKVVSASKLVARIQIPAGAPVASYDVEVMLIGGKKGVGAELFFVAEKDPAATFYVANDAGLGVKGDGKYLDGAGASVFAPGQCAIATRIFATASGSNSGDATMNLSGAHSGKCGRWITIDYGDGVVSQVADAFINVNRIHNTTYSIPVGATVTRGLNLADVRCGGLRWKGGLNDGTVTGADSVLVTRVDASTWVVQSQPAPNDRAYCVNLQRTFRIPLRFTVVASRPLP